MDGGAWVELAFRSMRLCIAACLIAASANAQTAPAPTWSLSPRPTIDIGDEANTQTQFNGVVGVVRMPRGEIVVANGLSQELRVFSAGGAYVRTLSQAGRGAGELRALNRLWRSGDTIIVAELLQNESNVHMFSTTGYLGKRAVGAANAGGISPLDRFPDGRYAITAAPRSVGPISAGVQFSDSIPLGVLSLADLGNPRWIGALTSQMLIVPGFGGGRGRGRSNAVPYLFGRSEIHAISGDRLWVGDSETGIVEQFNSLGGKVGEFVVPIAQRPLDTLAIRRQRMSMLNDAMNWNDRARIDASYSIPLPGMAPRFTRFLPGPGGEMWVELYAEDRAAARTFLVLDRGGRAIGRVAIPSQVQAFEMGSDYVLGVRRDADGLERVVRHALTRR
jgi:hypothetical protein